MPYPVYVPTRIVTIGGAMGMENAQDLKVRVSIRSSRSLVWDDTGYRFEQAGYEGISEPGAELAVELITTDTAGWRDPVLHALIDVSAPGSYTHSYTAQVSFIDGFGRAVGKSTSIGPFTLPTGAGSLDLDKILPTDDVAGGVIYVPDIWSSQITDETARATAAEDQLRTDSVPQTVLLAGPEPSGDETGDTDTAALIAALNSERVVVLPESSTYYVNATLPLKQYGGLSMSDNTKIVWVGAAGGTVLATVPFTSISQGAFRGVVEGGDIVYPYASISATTKVIYIAQPWSSKPLTTRITSDSVDITDIGLPTIAGSAGWVLDGNTNPGPFVISSIIHGQFENQIWCRTSHVTAVACQGAYGGSLITFDNDSLNSAMAGIDCVVQSPHTFANHVAAVRMKYGRSITVIGGLNEPDQENANGLGISDVIRIEASATGGNLLHLNPDRFAGNSVKHYSPNAQIRVLNVQDGYDATYIGQESGVPIVVRPRIQWVEFGVHGEYGTASTSELTMCAVSPVMRSGPAGIFRVRFVGYALNNTGGEGYRIGLYQVNQASIVSSTMPGASTPLDNKTYTRNSVDAAGEWEPVAIEAILTGQNTPATKFAAAILAVGGGTASGRGLVTVDVM